MLQLHLSYKRIANVKPDTQSKRHTYVYHHLFLWHHKQVNPGEDCSSIYPGRSQHPTQILRISPRDPQQQRPAAKYQSYLVSAIYACGLCMHRMSMLVLFLLCVCSFSVYFGVCVCDEIKHS